MYRILGIFGSFLACSALLVWSVDATVGPEALERGSHGYVYRQFFDKILGDPTPAPRPLVVWMGDSTIMGNVRPSYPQLLRPSLLLQNTDSLVIAGAGFDAYVHYFLIGRVLELEPAVVVIVAHLSAFHPKGAIRAFTYNDAASYLLPSALPRTFLLPLAQRNLSPARLLLAQTLNFETPQQILFTAEGVRTLYEEAPFWEALGPPKAPSVFNPAFREAVRGYDIALTRRQATVQMLEATVRAVTEAGHVAVVIATPIPHETLLKRPWYDAATTQRRIDVIRDATRDAGGLFADLHTLLPQQEFADYGGHFGPVGAQRVADVVLPIVRRALRQAERAARARLRADAVAP